VPADLVPDPEHSFAADLDAQTLLVEPGRCLVLAPVTDAVRAPGGVASLGMVVTLADFGASDPALVACAPDWTATQDLSLHGAGWVDEGPVLVDCRLVRVGKKVVVVSVDAYDGHGEHDLDALRSAVDQGRPGPTHAARGLVTFARLPRTAAHDMDDYDPARWLGRVRRRTTPSPADGTMYERMGLRVVDAAAGRVEQPRTAYVANSIGTINGGAQAVLAQVAAEGMCPGRTAVDMELHYLSQVKVGPARTVATVLRHTDDHSVVDVRLRDAGNADQLLAIATVGLRTRSC